MYEMSRYELNSLSTKKKVNSILTQQELKIQMNFKF